MDIILNNPFRILGLPVTASARQISKRVHDLSMLSEFGKVPEYPGDLAFIGDVDRSSAAIERAAQDLELPERKLNFANFWFWIDNSVDELVIDVLRDGEIDKALSLWNRAIENKSISSKTLSSYRNYALLSFVASCFKTPVSAQIDPHELGDFIQSSVKALSHAAYLPLAERIAGTTYEVRPDTVLVRCADEIAKFLLSGTDGLDADRARSFIGAFSNTSAIVQRHVKSKFVAQRVTKVERLIEACAAVRNEEPERAHDQGVALYRASDTEISYLLQLLPPDDPYLAGISDKVAEELIGCSTDIYNEVDDTERALALSRELSEYAKKFAVGLRTKKRVADDLALIDKLLGEHRLGMLVEKIEAELARVPDLDGPMPPGIRSIEITKRLLANTKTPLQKLKAHRGDGPILYQQLGGVVGTIALVMCIRFVNETNNYALVTPLMCEIETLPMTNEQRAHFERNKEILDRNLVAEQSHRAPTRTSGGGCYIATLVYGGDDEPPVIKLRQFRDEVLLPSVAGRLFVQTYYFVAPTLVSWLKHVPSVQRVVRGLLDFLTRRLP